MDANLRSTLAQASRSCLLASAGLAALIAAAGDAAAGGFAVREQSAEFQGLSFAGNAAGGGGLSGMFWNPAVAGQFNGIRSESHWSVIFPFGEVNALAGTTLNVNPALARSSGDIGETAVVPSGYLSYQLSQQFVLGASFGAPFGLSTKPENQAWVGQVHSRDSALKTYNGQLALAYRAMPSLTVAAGFMVQLIDGELKQASGSSATSSDAAFRANDTGYGWTAGVTWRPVEGTHLGVGYRSQIDHTLTGVSFIDKTSFAAGVKADVTTPETVTASLRQALSPQLAFLATVEWTKWSRLQKLDIICTQRDATLCPSGSGSLSTSLPFGWHDGWFYSAGLEYAFSPGLKLRAGGAYEKSPIQNASERSPRVPDNDRIWGSVGATAKVNDTVTLDLAYSHIWVDDGQIDRTASGTRLVAETKGSVDIVSIGVKFKLGGASEPLK